MLMPIAEGEDRVPILVEMVEHDLSQPGHQSRQEILESYLAAFPELENSETVSTELFLAEYQSLLRSGKATDLDRLAARFPRQAAVLRRLIERHAQDPATGSVLGQIGKTRVRPPCQPVSVANDAKVPVELPRQFDRYRILKRLGQGAMGVVYLVHDTLLGRRVALKVPRFRPETGAATPDRHFLDRFYHEARTAATLDHPNLCPVYDVGQVDGIPYLTMAYIKGRPLSRYIRRDRPMSQRRVASIVRKLAVALEEAHYSGVIHRDLKPSNIMVNARRDLIIMDFGLVWRMNARDERMTKVGLVVGTPAYMSPEQVSGKVEEIGPHCDIYSLGVIMYELLTGCRPFEGPDAFILGQILFVEPPPPSRHRPDLDPELEAICMKAMAKRLDERYATMGELAMALGDYLRGGSGTSRLMSGVGPVGVSQNGAGAGARSLGEEDAATPSSHLEDPLEDEPVGAEQSISIEVAEPAPLWKAWIQWTTIIEQFALRRSRHHVDGNAYDKLYKGLIKTCRDRSAKDHGPRRDFYRKLEELVLPWLTPKSLAQTDREILYSLLCYCREAEQELRDQMQLSSELGDWIEAWANWRLVAVVLLGALVATGWLLWH